MCNRVMIAVGNKTDNLFKLYNAIGSHYTGEVVQKVGEPAKHAEEKADKGCALCKETVIGIGREQIPVDGRNITAIRVQKHKQMIKQGNISDKHTAKYNCLKQMIGQGFDTVFIIYYHIENRKKTGKYQTGNAGSAALQKGTCFYTLINTAVQKETKQKNSSGQDVSGFHSSGFHKSPGSKEALQRIFDYKHFSVRCHKLIPILTANSMLQCFYHTRFARGCQ